MLESSGLRYIEFHSERDFSLILDEFLKGWHETKEIKREREAKKEHVKSILIRCEDRPGILSCIYKLVFQMGGDVSRARQAVNLGRTSCKLISSWRSFDNAPEDAVIKESIHRDLTKLLNGGEIEVFINQIVDSSSVVTARAFFEINFFDGPGTADRIFQTLSKRSLSVIESRLEQLSKNPQIAQFSIVVNSTDVSPDNILLASSELRKSAGVFRVDSHVQHGTWYY